MQLNQVYTIEQLKNISIHDLRVILRSIGGTPGELKKDKLIQKIIDIQNGEETKRNNRGRRSLDQYTVNNSEADQRRENFFKVMVSDSEDSVTPFSQTKVQVTGVLDVLADGYGFLRVENYENSSKDVFVARPTIKNNYLRKGDLVSGVAVRKRENESPALEEVTSVNGERPNDCMYRYNFDDLVPYYPEEKLSMEIENQNDIAMRCIDLFCPIGKGQRGLIVSPPKAGKTTLLKKIAKSIETNYKDATLIVLLIDERPEEVTDITRSVKGEVVYSTFDESPDHHIKASELVLSRAKRLVEMGKDVIILLDSITKLARAYNGVVPSSGKTLSGGLDPTALQAPKKFFGSARNIEEGGSLTIVATALVETGSRMDDVIFEEFKGTGNMEIRLSRELSERRIFPAIDIYASGTRRDELLLSEAEFDGVLKIRRIFEKDNNAVRGILDMMGKTNTNEEFVEKLNSWIKVYNGEKN